MSISRFDPQRWAMSAYILFVLIVMPQTAILRVLQLAEPGVLRNLVLPFLLAFFVLAYRVSKVVVPRAPLQYLLLFVFFQAFIVGGYQLNGVASIRNFASHLFQIASAYVMFGVGWLSINTFGYKFWRRWGVLALISIGIASVGILTVLAAGRVGRLYTPIYGIIFVMSSFGIYSKKGAIASYTLLIISNKRATIVAIVAMSIYHFVRDARRSKGNKYLVATLGKATVALAVLVVLFSLAVKWASNVPEGERNGAADAINITYNRLAQTVRGADKEHTLDDLSSGRFDEINAALDDADWWNWIIGSGAGWAVKVHSVDEPVHNIHFTPLSLVMVFGLPFSLLLYGTFLSLLWKASRKSRRIAVTPTERMAALYLVAAAVASLFAYSLFVDLLVFFFTGVLTRSQSATYRLQNTVDGVV